MSFNGILFNQPTVEINAEEPAFFADLNLDQVLASMTAGREEYDLTGFFYTPLRSVETVRYRQDILRDLEGSAVFDAVREFAGRMVKMREHLAQADKLHFAYQKQRWFLDAIEIYCGAVQSLAAELARGQVRSRGLQAFGRYLAGYVESDGFASLASETQELYDAVDGVRYCVHIKGSRVKVTNFEEELDYSAEVEQTFAKFKQGAVKDYRVKYSSWPEMNHVEAQVLEGVARLYPDVFQALLEYHARHQAFLDRTIGDFDREVQFYMAYLEFIQRLKSADLPFCYPHVSARSKEVRAHEAFDIALANSLVSEDASVVRNDFYLEDPERILVITGPNQGGKTTLARSVGQLHHLAALGLPVPASTARLFLPDRLFTHFEREEDLATLRGKLEDELVRLHDILGEATSDSIVIMNESFTSTTLRDALVLGTEVMTQLIDLQALCVCVTFVDELASLSDATVSMVSTVVPDNPAMRTYKVVRRSADGLAYAAAIAEKYGLTYESLSRRIAR